jgi:methylmalonyl-CoA mutase
MFTNNVLLVGGIDFPSSEGGTPEEIAAKAGASGSRMAILCSSAKIYADQAIAVATALKGAGIETVYIAGRKTEIGDQDTSVIDGEVFDGMDVVAFLEGALDRIGVAK